MAEYEYFPEIRALLLLIAANAIPVLVAHLARDRWRSPLDFGYVLADGQCLFGVHKTWRGFWSGTVATALVGSVLGLPLWLGATVGLLSLLGDALSSCVKRRLRLAPGTECVGLDQLGEALLPLLLLGRYLSLDLGGTLRVASAFMILDIATAQLRGRRQSN